MHELPSRIYALGPEGTFSDQAAQRLRGKTATPRVAIEYTRTIPEVLARTEADGRSLGVVPIENSIAGTVNQAQDFIVQHRLTIIWEINVHVRFSLLANAPLEDVAVYYAHPQAFDQCSEYLAANMPKAGVEFTNSNTESGARLLREDVGDEGQGGGGKGKADGGVVPAAAIVPLEFGAAHAEQVVAEDIQNYPNNTTRFLVIRRTKAEEHYDFSRNKTSLLVEPNEDRPGLLHELLRIFHAHDLNLCRLESRPAKTVPWAYVFYIDFNNNPHSHKCLEELQATPNRITVLGSYDLMD